MKLRFVLLGAFVLVSACTGSDPEAAGSGGKGGTSGSGGKAGASGSAGTAGSGGGGAAPVTCDAGQTACGSSCVTLASDAANCGVCGRACSSGQLCDGGTCHCQAGLTACGSACVDLQSDGANCGACGMACGGSNVCSLGSCSDACAAGLQRCGQSCVNVATNSQNCGACGITCPAGSTCNNGTCGCSGVQTLCGSSCVNTRTNAANCGSCGNACEGGSVCTDGSCQCSLGQTSCGGRCAAIQSDPANCGACGNQCPAGASCVGGACMAGAGGSPGTGGAGGNGGSAGGIVTSCSGGVSVNENPLGCDLAWGANGNSGNRSSYLRFITTWVGYEPNGGLNGACDGCNLARNLASTNATAVYYAYFIGYQANTQGGFGDCNTDHDGQNLCTRGAQWLRSNRSQVINMYANYAQKTYQASPNKGVLWLLEGDFVQYTYDEQSNPFTMQELGELAGDIVCAIKGNAPNAMVAINHSPWVDNDLINRFWGAMPLSSIDMVWTTGVGNNNGFITAGTTASSYNGATARYSYLSNLTGKRILVDTSFGASQAQDTWTINSASVLNQRIAEGVSAVNVTDGAPSQSTVSNLAPQLNDTCQ